MEHLRFAVDLCHSVYLLCFAIGTHVEHVCRCLCSIRWLPGLSTLTDSEAVFVTHPPLHVRSSALQFLRGRYVGRLNWRKARPFSWRIPLARSFAREAVAF